jgi:hypothetical protein
LNRGFERTPREHTTYVTPIIRRAAHIGNRLDAGARDISRAGDASVIYRLAG